MTSFTKYPCHKCGRMFYTNPDEPPPAHNKPDSAEPCITAAEAQTLSDERWRPDADLVTEDAHAKKKGK